MKVAMAEVNKTFIMMALIAIVGAAGVILVPQMTGKTSQNMCCSDVGGLWVNNTCYDVAACEISAAGSVQCDASGRIAQPCKIKSNDCIDNVCVDASDIPVMDDLFGNI